SVSASSSMASRPSRRAFSAKRTMRGITSSGVWRLSRKAARNTAGRLRTCSREWLTKVAARVPPRTMNQEGTSQNSRQSLPLRMAHIMEATPMKMPRTVVRSMRPPHCGPGPVHSRPGGPPSPLNGHLPLQVYQFLQHLVGRGDDAGVGLEPALGDDHGREFLGQV